MSGCDVVITGGGVVGSACAFFLATHPDFHGSIAVIEPDPSYRGAASSRSASSIRQQFSTPINIALSRFGLEFLRRPPSALLAAGKADWSLVESSYLYLCTSLGQSTLEGNVAIQRTWGVPVTLHDRRALGDRYPWLHTEDLAAGADTVGAEGWFDGYALLSSLKAVNERMGVRYVRDRADGFEQSQGRITAVTLRAAGRMSCGCAVIASGTQSRELAANLGIELPVFARKRNVFVLTCPVTLPSCPLVVDPSGLWFRPERDRFLCGVPTNPDPDADPSDFEVDLELFESRGWPALAHRVPAFESVRVTAAWAGHYDYNVFDQNAFVGPLPGVSNGLLAAGFSGHGLQHAPGIGRGLAELIVDGAYRTLDLAPLSYARFLVGTPLRESNVI